MSNKHLRGLAHTIRGTTTAWWFEEPDGICVVQQYHDGKPGPGMSTLTAYIPWAQLKGALARKEKV